MPAAYLANLTLLTYAAYLLIRRLVNRLHVHPFRVVASGRVEARRTALTSDRRPSSRPTLEDRREIHRSSDDIETTGPRRAADRAAAQPGSCQEYSYAENW
ncbi:hypothetical protein [Nannocystis bainbridge]|uniref:hypothetical protein n=1 Tax=Nannocystis bainbridge TaxID=2995303 RepID=UPI00232B4B0E|nr:hypothetical protein [Nannocystis bainbridge]